MSKFRWSLILTGTVLLGLVYRCLPTRITHSEYTFELPLDFVEAIDQFGLDSISPRMAVRYDDREWLKVKVIKNHVIYSRLLGLNFYYDNTISRDSVMKVIEKKTGGKFKSGSRIYPPFKENWWYLKMNEDVLVLIYPHSKYQAGSYMQGEESRAGKGQGKQFVVAYVYRIESKFGERTLIYIREDGSVPVNELTHL